MELVVYNRDAKLFLLDRMWYHHNMQMRCTECGYTTDKSSVSGTVDSSAISSMVKHLRERHPAIYEFLVEDIKAHETTKELNFQAPPRPTSHNIIKSN